MIEFFDSHAHYQDEKFAQDQKQIVEACYEEGITNMVVAGYNLQSSKEAIRLSKAYHFIYATCGISPNDIEHMKAEELTEIEKLAEQENKIVAIRRDWTRLLLE